MDTRLFGAILLALGILVVVAGLLLLFGLPSWLGWIGRLPGDIRIDRDGLKVFIPITSMIVLSLLLTLLLNVLRRLF